jgi:hypothetical protein
MSLVRHGALKLAALLAVAFLAICGGEARASSLGLALRVQQDFYTPLVPVTKNFRTCFKMDSTGRQILGLCIDDPNAVPNAVPTDTAPARVPAAARKTAPAKTPAPKKPTRK